MAEVNVEAKLAELDKLKAELEKLKTEKQQVQTNVLRFPDSLTKKRQEATTAGAFKAAVLRDCKKELADYFTGLNPRHSKVKYDQSGEFMENLIAAATKAVGSVLPQYPFRVEGFIDNFFVKEGETADLKLNRIDGRKETERPVENDWIRLDFVYNNCIIGAENKNAANAYWTTIDGSNTDISRVTISVLQREAVVTAK